VNGALIIAVDNNISSFAHRDDSDIGKMKRITRLIPALLLGDSGRGFTAMNH